MRRCAVVGIGPDAESLAKAEERLRDSDVVIRYGLDLDFLALPEIAEEVGPDGWRRVAALGGLLVDFTLAVHHMRGQRARA